MNTRSAGMMCLVLAAAAAAAHAQQPTVEVITPEDPARPGEAYRVDIAVTWDGASNAYVVGPPNLPDIDWGTARAASAGGKRSNADEEGSASQIIQTIEIIADNEGSFDLASVSLPYIDTSLPPMPVEEGQAPPEPPLLSVPRIEIEVRKGVPLWLYGGGAAMIVLVVAGAVVASYRLRRGASVPPSTAPATAAAAREALHAAKKHRLDGDYYAFFAALRSGAQVFRQSEAGSQLYQKLDEWADRAGYGNARPTHEDLDGLQRDYERTLQDFETREASGATSATG